MTVYDYDKPVSSLLRGFGPNGEKIGDPHPKCDYCDATEGVRWRGAHTAYSDYWPKYSVVELIKYDWDPPLPPDPNPPRPLCEECSERDTEYWDEMWKEANYGRM